MSNRNYEDKTDYHRPNSADFAHIRSCPTLYTYLESISARVKNFRRFVVEEKSEEAYTGWRTLATIRLSSEGDINVNGDRAYAPSEEVAARIKEEVTAAAFPKSIDARSIEPLLEKHLVGVDDKDIFPFVLPGGLIRFVQVRAYKDSGEKIGDLPWTLFSDMEWRMMEPDGALPLWGQDHIANGFRFLIHEGASAAMKVRRLVEEGGERLAAHPWAEDLKSCVHLGWPGGTDRVHDVDWGPVKKLGPEKIVDIVADHDRKGQEAVAQISRVLSRSLGVIMFDNHFPPTFDLADPWPQHDHWWRKGRYVGLTFDDLRKSATWATAEVKVPYVGKGRPPNPTYRARNEFAAEWLWIENIDAFVSRAQTNRLLTSEQFDHSVRPFSHVGNTSKLLVKHISSHVNSAIYRPGGIKGIIAVPDIGRAINIYRPPTIKAIKGDIAPFLEFMEHLVPDEDDRKETLRWCATLIAKPIKMTYALLLVSETEGVGKGTLGEAILAPLVGLWNTSFPTEHEIVEANFNDWQCHKRLAVVHEIYSGHNWKATNKLKSTITDRQMSVRKKYLANYTDENHINILACSNSPRALMLDNSDRRWLMPTVTEDKKDFDYWREFYEWLYLEGLGIIQHWATIDFLENGRTYVEPGQAAPDTTRKRSLITESRSHAENVAFDLGSQMLARYEGQKKVLVVNDAHKQVARLVDMRATDHRFAKPLAIRKALIEAGWKELRRARPEPENGPHADPRFPLGNGEMSYVVTNFEPEGPVRSWTEVKDFRLDEM